MVSNYKSLPQQEYLKECFDYNPEIGELRWKERPLSHFKSKRSFSMWNSKFANKVSCSVLNTGYSSVTINKDGNVSNNKIENLKLATRVENGMNNGISRNNTSGNTRIRLAENGRFQSEIRINGKNMRLGTFDTLEEAIVTREIKREEVYGEKIKIR